MKRALLAVSLFLIFIKLCPGQMSPDDFFSLKVGSDRTLVAYPDISRYFQYLGRESNRIKVTDEGSSTRNNPMLLAFISSAENIRNLEELIQMNLKLSRPDMLSYEEASILIRKAKVFVLVTAAIHASEIAATQMAMIFAHQLSVTSDEKQKYLLDNVVILLMPSINPDGNIMVSEWYRKNIGTEFEGARMPYLYHHYAGHDTNRDFFMINLKETQVVNAVLHQRYFPHIFLDMHQMGRTGPRMFVPPFKDPMNQNLSPLLVQQTNLIGSFMAMKLQEAGKSGVANAYAFDAYWPGGSKNTAWYKNVVGVLTELASVDMASPVYIEANELRISSKGLPEYKAQVNFPDPWTGGWWRLKDIIEYELIAVNALIEIAAQNRESFLKNFYSMGVENIRRGESEPPYVYIIPDDQWDRPTALTFLKKMKDHGVNIFHAQEDFIWHNKIYKRGSYVIPLNQPYRNFIKVMMERQQYPDVKQMRGGPILEPYDSAGWTLPLQMGVCYEAVNKPIKINEKTFSPARHIEYPKETIIGTQGDAFLISARYNRSFIVVNRLYSAGIPVYRLRGDINSMNSNNTSPGTFMLKNADISAATLTQILKGTGVDAERARLDDQFTPVRIKKPAIGLYQSYLANIDEGWTRWVLDHFKFSYSAFHNPDIKNKKLLKKIDVLIIPDMERSVIIDGKYNRRRSSFSTPSHPDFRGGIGKEGIRNLKDFVASGGVLILLDSSSGLALDDFSLPLTDILKNVDRDKFYCPGSILKIKVDSHDPLGWGMPPESIIFFSHSPAFRTNLPTSPKIDRKVVAVFADREPHLLSGYIKGEKLLNRAALIIRFDYYKGHVIVLGGRVQHRSQTFATFKFLFNAILYP